MCMDRLFANAIYNTVSFIHPAAGGPFQLFSANSRRIGMKLFGVGDGGNSTVVFSVNSNGVSSGNGNIAVTGIYGSYAEFDIRDSGRGLVQSEIYVDIVTGPTASIVVGVEIIATEDILPYLNGSK